MQICPWWNHAPNAAALAAASRSASSRMMRLLAPPSSSDTFLRCCPANAPMRRPTVGEPVKAIMGTRSSTTSASPASASPGTTCSRPLGRPASSNTRAMMKPPLTGVRVSGLSTTALPSASAGATERRPRMSGKLNGEITPTTPCGTRRAIDRRPGVLGSTWPWACMGKAAARWHSVMASRTSCWPLGTMPPVSRATVMASSSKCCSKMLAARWNTAARSRGPVAAHAACACCARPMAACMSAALAMPTRLNTWPVAGSSASRAVLSTVDHAPSKALPAHRRLSSRPGFSETPIALLLG